MYNYVIGNSVFLDVFGGYDLKNTHKFRLDFNKKALVVLSCSFSVIVTVILAAVFFGIGVSTNESVDALPVTSYTGVSDESITDIDFTDVSTLEMRGLWIASVSNINYPSKTGLTEKQLKAEIEEIFENAHSLGINSVFFQVRPACDALYNSDIFPASRYVSGTQGKTVSGFDSLEYVLEVAERYNIDVHAWVNPFRVAMDDTEAATLSDNHPVSQHPEYAIRYGDGKTYLDPGNPEVRNLVVEGVKEILIKYPDVAGIHFDDYFYPYPAKGSVFNDAVSYSKYSDGMELSDWRRENVNKVVRETYEAVKQINPDVKFGVSVFGILANKGSDTPYVGSNTSGLEAYSEIYCDALSWVNGKYVDYLAPQNYWSFDTSAAPFDDVARWWNAYLDGTGVDLYFGHAAYKSGDYKKNEIHKQVQMARSLASYKGSIFYGYENIKQNIGGVADDIKLICRKKAVRSSAVSNSKPIKITFPDDGAKLNIAKSYIIGSCDPAYPLYVNGVPVSKTTGGYFGLYLDLNGGKNTFTFTQNGKTLTHTIYRQSPGATYYNGTTELEGMEISSVYPSGSTWLENGEKLYVSCVAPAGSNVTARVGDTEIVLKPQLYPKGEGKYLYEKYEGNIDPSVLVEDTGFRVLGNVEFTAELLGERATETGGEIARKGADSFVYAEVKNDYTHTKVGTSSSFYDDFLPSSKGMRDYVVSAKNGYCKMRFGGYVKEENLVFTYGKPLLLNVIGNDSAVFVNAKDTTNNKNNSTDIRIKVTENVPVDVDFNGKNGAMRIIIYNTDTSIIPEILVPENPLIESIEGEKSSKENMLFYHVTLKEKDNFYGFRIVYEKGCLVIKLNNPQTLHNSDKPLYGKKIVVDAGHGGTDIGAPGPGDKPEKVLNANIAEHLADILRELGATVIETRPDDNTIDLYGRMDILTAECPDMAISVHHNSVAASSNALKARGFMALYSNNSGVSLAKTVSDVTCHILGRDQKPTAYQQLAVARNHMFPSTLVEMNFISNVEEYQWSINEGNDLLSAQALAEGILEYYRNQEKYLDY